MVVNERAADKQSWAANMVKYSQAHRRRGCNNPSSQLDLLAEVAAYAVWMHLSCFDFPSCFQTDVWRANRLATEARWRLIIVKLPNAVREHARCFCGKRALDKLARDVNDCCAKL